MPIEVPGAKPGASPLFVVKKTEQEALDDAKFKAWMATEAGFIQSFFRFDDKPIRLEDYQIAFLNNKAQYRGIDKSRQTGFSFIFANEAVARCHLKNKHTALFVSYNLEDAKEKINYARQLTEELPLAYRKKIVNDSNTQLAFESNGAVKHLSRIISNPSKAPRGKTGDIYLDELAHYRDDRAVYDGSTALVLRSHAQFTICSTPLGKRGKFWEVMMQEVKPYKAYRRQRVPWWLCSFFCTDILLASIEAPKMYTEQRVAKFGTKGIKEQFESLDLDAFQQEFECLYIDESTAFFPYDLIMGCQPTGDDEIFLTDDPLLLDSKYVRGCRLTAGFDVGRKKDLSELVVISEKNDLKTMVLRKSFDRKPFATQEAEIRNVLDHLPIVKLKIDQNGIGMNMAENLARDYPSVVEPFIFTHQSKEILATDFKIDLQKRKVALPCDRYITSQIHSIKRRVTASGNAVYDSESDGGRNKGHADLFWALALAASRERGQVVETAEIGVHIIDFDSIEASDDDTFDFEIE